MTKINRDSIYLHSIFVTVILVSRPLFNYLYTKDYHFNWSIDFHPVVLLFYVLVFAVIYFTAFVILKNRTNLKSPVAITFKVLGFVAMFFLFIPLRYFVDQHLSDWLIGITNYPKEVRMSFYFRDNLLISFYVMLSALFLKFMNDWYVQDRHRSALERQNLQLELNFLKSQVNPHFLFNTLNNIQSYIVQNEQLKSIELIGRLSEFMRFALYECNEEYIELQKEIDMLQDYIVLEKVRCEDHVTITFETSGPFGDYKIPPLLLMPFVENAFKHGADMHLSQSFISIAIHLQNDQLSLTVENNFSTQNSSEHRDGGIGLKNVERRLAHYFSNQHQLQISTERSIFTINLALSFAKLTQNQI